MSPGTVRRATLWQDAVRLLLLIDTASQDASGDPDPTWLKLVRTSSAIADAGEGAAEVVG